MRLFGMDLDSLFRAIAEVESDNGKTSPNIYQIDEGVDDTASGSYVADVNRIVGRVAANGGRPGAVRFCHDDVYDRGRSELMMFYYWYWWGMNYQNKTGNRVTPEVLARIHNGGPLGWKKAATVRYWHKVADRLLDGSR